MLQQPEQLQPQRIPPSYHTPRGASDALSIRSGLSISTRNIDNQMSPATPRSLPVQTSIRQSVDDPYYPFTESPIEDRDLGGHRHIHGGVKYDRNSYDMEHYSELDDGHGVESEEEHEEEEEDDDDDATLENHTKKQKLSTGISRPSYNTTNSFFRGSQHVEGEQNEANIASEMPNGNINEIGEDHRDEERSNPEEMAGICQQGASGSALGDVRPPRKGRKPKTAAQKRGPRRTSLPTSHGDTIDQYVSLMFEAMVPRRYPSSWS